MFPAKGAEIKKYLTVLKQVANVTRLHEDDQVCKHARDKFVYLGLIKPLLALSFLPMDVSTASLPVYLHTHRMMLSASENYFYFMGPQAHDGIIREKTYQKKSKANCKV